MFFRILLSCCLLTLVSILSSATPIYAEDIHIEVVVPAICGNGVIEGNEACDTGAFGANTCITQGFTGGNISCTAACTLNTENCTNNGGVGIVVPPPPPQPPAPICGNGIIEQAEQCDDGNNQNNDGCSAACQIEIAVCGNGIIEQAEQCDDGNNQNNDGCSAACQIEINPICGNGQIENGEQCDDGNQAPGDGCSPLCQVEAPVVPPVDPENPDLPPLNPPVEPQNPGNPEVGNNNGDGGEAIAVQRIPEQAIIRWIANRSIIVNTPELTTISGDIFSIAIRTEHFPENSIQKVTAVYNNNTQAFTFNQANEHFIAGFRATNQTEDIQIQVELQDGRIYEARKTITIASQGRVTSGGELVRDAEILLLDVDAGGGIFPAVRYGQLNPMFSSEFGTYAFLVPNGNYIIIAKKNAYSERRTFSFVVSNNVINQSIKLVKIIPTIEEVLNELPEDATPQQKTVAVVKNIGEKTIAQTKKVLERTNDVAKKIQEISDNPQVEEAFENVVAPASVGVATAAVIPSLWSILIPLLRFLFLQPILLIGKKNRKQWGVVYNSLTKLPVDLAMIRLIDAETNRIKQSRVTDTHGRYLFIVEPGEYKIEVVKSGFIYPSNILAGIEQDGEFLDVYHGEVLGVLEKEVNVTPNIPIDPPGAEKTPARIIKEKRLKMLQHAISMSGIILSLISFYVSPTLFVGATVALQVIVYILFILFVKPKKPKGWGIVKEQVNGKTIPGTVVRLFTKKYNKLVASQVADKKGRYAFLVGPNTYYISAEKPGFEKYTSSDIVITKTGKGSFLHEDLSLKKLGEEKTQTTEPIVTEIQPKE